jgi:hypothetical protein
MHLIKADDAKALKAIYWALNGAVYRMPVCPQIVGTPYREAFRLVVTPNHAAPFGVAQEGVVSKVRDCRYISGRSTD